MISWNDGIEGEARSARRGMEDAVLALSRARRLRLLLIVALVINVAAALLRAVILFIGPISLVGLGFLFVLVLLAGLVWSELPGSKNRVLRCEDEVTHRKQLWDQVCARLARGET